MIKELTVERGDPVRWAGPMGWGFWDEVWLEFYGGYPSRAEAVGGLARYAHWLETGCQKFPW